MKTKYNDKKIIIINIKNRFLFLFIFVLFFYKNYNSISAFKIKQKKNHFFSSNIKISKKNNPPNISLEKKKYLIVENYSLEKKFFIDEKKQEYYFKIFLCENKKNREKDFSTQNNDYINNTEEYHKLYKNQNVFVNIKARLFLKEINNEQNKNQELLIQNKNITENFNIEVLFNNNNNWENLKNTNKIPIFDGKKEILITISDYISNKEHQITKNSKIELCIEFDLVDEDNNIFCKEIEKEKIIQNLENNNKKFITKIKLDYNNIIKSRKNFMINFSSEFKIKKELEKFKKFYLYEEFERSIIYYNQKMKYDVFFCYLNSKNEIKINKCEKFEEISKNYLKEDCIYINNFLKIKDIKKIFIIFPKTIYNEDDYKTYSDVHWTFRIESICEIDHFKNENFKNSFLDKILNFFIKIIQFLQKNKIELINQKTNEKYLINLYSQNELLEQKIFFELKNNKKERKKIKLKLNFQKQKNSNI
nr:hypothetical protein [Candidatus Phytoplasma sacchari]